MPLNTNTSPAKRLVAIRQNWLISVRAFYQKGAAAQSDPIKIKPWKGVNRPDSVNSRWLTTKAAQARTQEDEIGVDSSS